MNEDRRIKAKLNLLNSTELPVNQLLVDFWNFRKELEQEGAYPNEDALRLFKVWYIDKLPKDKKQQKLF